MAPSPQYFISGVVIWYKTYINKNAADKDKAIVIICLCSAIRFCLINIKPLIKKTATKAFVTE